MVCTQWGRFPLQSTASRTYTGSASSSNNRFDGALVTTRSRPTLAQLATQLSTQQTTSRQLVTDCLTRISAATGEGSRVFLKVYGEQALATADYYDRMRQHGARLNPFAGIPVSIKDLFDVAGDTTLAGSTLFKGTPVAERDARAGARRRAAGGRGGGRAGGAGGAVAG